MSETLIEPDAADAKATVLELDELWSFVLKKTNQAWIWIALCRKTLSFSKSMVMHTICRNLFLHRYNLERVTVLS